MQYELLLWEQTVADKVPLQPNWKVHFQLENERIKLAIQKVLNDNHNPNVVERYIQMHKLSLLNLMDTLLRSPSQKGAEKHYNMVASIEELLHFLTERASRFLLQQSTTDQFTLYESLTHPAKTRGIDDQKIVTSLRSAELGLLLRLFIDTGVFRTRNRKGLSRFMAQYVVTFQKNVTEVLSSDHIYNTIYSTTNATLDSTQQLLQKMINQINKIRLETRKKR